MPPEVPPDAPQQVSDLFDIYRDLNKKNLLEGYHDSVQAMDEALNLFNLGNMSIEMRAMTERLFWAVGMKTLKMVQELDFAPEELQGLDTLLSDTYFCNFSIFQSMPDSWAIKQLFPIMPIHRLLRAADAPGRAGRHHLRLGRQGRSVHRPARRPQHAGTASLQRPALLSGRLPAGGLSGDPRRSAQPLRRHQRRARQHR